jgi:hypothetical protein
LPAHGAPNDTPAHLLDSRVVSSRQVNNGVAFRGA